SRIERLENRRDVGGAEKRSGSTARSFRLKGSNDSLCRPRIYRIRNLLLTNDNKPGVLALIVTRDHKPFTLAERLNSLIDRILLANKLNLNLGALQFSDFDSALLAQLDL